MKKMSDEDCYGLYMIMTRRELDGHVFTEEEKLAAARDWLRRHPGREPDLTPWAHFAHSEALKIVRRHEGATTTEEPEPAPEEPSLTVVPVFRIILPPWFPFRW